MVPIRPTLMVALLSLVAVVACKAEQERAAVAAPPTPAAEAAATEAPEPPDATVGEDGTPGSTGATLAAVATGMTAPTAASTGTEKDAPTEPAAPPKEQRVLILGDSLAATAFGVLLQKRLEEHPHVKCFRKAKSASGLARPDFFDWMKESRRQVELRKPDLVVVIIGGNDGQDLTTKRKSKQRVRWKEPGWDSAYRRRIQEFLVGLTAPDRKILWLGLPRMGPRSFERKLELIRSIQRDVMSGMGDAGSYLDTTAMTSDAQGKVLRAARVRGRKRPQAIRADDGIHFTMAGSRYFADKVYPEVLSVLGLAAAD